MIGDLFINGKDAYKEWGMFLDETSLSALMTPAPNKEFIGNKSRLLDGKSVVVNSPKKDERNITLQLIFTAPSKDVFFARYNSFCDELDGGVLEIKTRHQPDVVYRTIYISCNQFSQFTYGIAKFALKLSEPNPKNRK